MKEYSNIVNFKSRTAVNLITLTHLTQINIVGLYL